MRVKITCTAATERIELPQLPAPRPSLKLVELAAADTRKTTKLGVACQEVRDLSRNLHLALLAATL